MSGEPKVYGGTIRFGAETDTDDAHGAIRREAVRPAHEAVEEAISALSGAIAQVPPAYSAKRVAGRRAYDLAREGAAPELAPVTVTVHHWTLLGWRGADLDVEITCSGGTYIRALARDLGRLTSSAAHLVALRRTASGPFHVTDAVTLEELRAGRAALRPPLDALPGIATQPLAPADVTRVVRGQEVLATVGGDRAALLSTDAHTLVAFAERRGERWQPRVVMRPPDAAAPERSIDSPTVDA
jgi:tRNA pseudouridine55 synthase